MKLSGEEIKSMSSLVFDVCDRLIYQISDIERLAGRMEFGIADGDAHEVGPYLINIVTQLMRVMSMCVGAERDISSRFLEKEEKK